MNFKIKFCINLLICLIVLMILFSIVQNYKNSVVHVGKTIIQYKQSSEIVTEKQQEPLEHKQEEEDNEEDEGEEEEEEDDFETPPISSDEMKYILIWTKATTVPFVYLGKGQEVVKSENCEYKNCYVTDNKNYLSDLTDFDALLFHIPEYVSWGHWGHFKDPEKRAPHQKYVLSCIESAHFYPICDSKYDNFFNWTWTYKLDADVKWGYMAIRDAETHKVVGPKKNMMWKNYENDVISEEKKSELKNKTKAVAWYVSNCYTKSGREKFAHKLGESLNKYGLQLDIYGKCGTMQCERGLQECFDKLKNEYFFYLSFENSFNEDYVTEKFVNAMKYGVVPIVWGGANYSNFAPPGSYINAREIDDPDKVAEMINNYIHNIDDYSIFFKWTKYYYYQRDIEDPESRALCNLCKALNDPVKMAEHKSYSNIKQWWNGNMNYC